jgi:hypothetical protein
MLNVGRILVGCGRQYDPDIFVIVYEAVAAMNWIS